MASTSRGRPASWSSFIDGAYGRICSVRASIWFRTSTADGNIVQGNLVGTDASGSLPLGNQGDGVLVDGGAGFELIGGAADGQGNVIADNGGSGVNISSGSGTAVLGNSIFGNHEFDIKNG